MLLRTHPPLFALLGLGLLAGCVGASVERTEPSPLDVARIKVESDLPLCVDDEPTRVEAAQCYAELRRRHFEESGVDAETVALASELDVMRVELYRAGVSNTETESRLLSRERELNPGGTSLLYAGGMSGSESVRRMNLYLANVAQEEMERGRSSLGGPPEARELQVQSRRADPLSYDTGSVEFERRVRRSEQASMNRYGAETARTGGFGPRPFSRAGWQGRR